MRIDMKQNQHQKSAKQTPNSDENRIQVNVILEGEDAAKFLRFREENRLRMNAPAGYRLIMERLDQLQPAA